MTYKKTALQKKLDSLASAYERQADRAIEEARQKYVIPFCDRTGARFTAGMGSWSFDKGPSRYIWPEDLPKRLHAVLSVSHHIYQQDVGATMADYAPKNWKGNKA